MSAVTKIWVSREVVRRQLDHVLVIFTVKEDGSGNVFVGNVSFEGTFRDVGALNFHVDSFGSLCEQGRDDASCRVESAYAGDIGERNLSRVCMVQTAEVVERQVFNNKQPQLGVKFAHGQIEGTDVQSGGEPSCVKFRTPLL